MERGIPPPLSVVYLPGIAYNNVTSPQQTNSMQ